MDDQTVTFDQIKEDDVVELVYGQDATS